MVYTAWGNLSSETAAELRRLFSRAVERSNVASEVGTTLQQLREQLPRSRVLIEQSVDPVPGLQSYQSVELHVPLPNGNGGNTYLVVPFTDRLGGDDQGIRVLSAEELRRYLQNESPA